MKVLHISTFEKRGGAALAAYRLHRGMVKSKACRSYMLVRTKETKDARVFSVVPSREWADRLRRLIGRRMVARERKRYAVPLSRVEIFSDDQGCWRDNILPQLQGFDILQLHWISQFLNFKRFFRAVPLHVPVVWRLADKNPFTGGCHYDAGCGRFAQACGDCPQLDCQMERDWSREIWLRKKEALDRLSEHRLHMVALNEWMAGQVKRSSLMGRFDCSVIPNGVDLDEFYPINPTAAREALGIPKDSQVLAFVAESTENSRKGFRLFIEALDHLRGREKLFLLVVGGKDDLPEMPWPCLNVENVFCVALLREIYSAAHIFVIPSIEDNQPNTVLEAMACGTPVVGFRVDGIPEMVDEGRTGLLAAQGNAKELAQAISFLLDNEKDRVSMGFQARRRAEKTFSREDQVRKYVELYSRLMARAGQAPSRAASVV